mmetsp:Transcript_22280/g.44690  ORF Transcript_22280/g.44690 Transcript_22280/m.44690 type:complete len:221 (-) Transcript_22280:76-738(-)
MLHNRVFDLLVDAVRKVALVTTVRDTGQSHCARAATDRKHVQAHKAASVGRNAVERGLDSNLGCHVEHSFEFFQVDLLVVVFVEFIEEIFGFLLVQFDVFRQESAQLHWRERSIAILIRKVEQLLSLRFHAGLVSFLLQFSCLLLGRLWLWLIVHYFLLLNDLGGFLFRLLDGFLSIVFDFLYHGLHLLGLNLNGFGLFIHLDGDGGWLLGFHRTRRTGF